MHSIISKPEEEVKGSKFFSIQHNEGKNKDTMIKGGK